MKDRILEYTGVFCDEAVLFREEDINKAIKELVAKVELSFGKVKITEYEVDVLTSLIASYDTHLPIEPLWVRNQKQKSFKRGKK